MSTVATLRVFRGHPIRDDGEQWRYVDTGEPTAGNRRACGHCGMEDTPEGHDGCLGTLPGVMNACCGHGRAEEAFVQLAPDDVIRGRAAVALIETMR